MLVVAVAATLLLELVVPAAALEALLDVVIELLANTELATTELAMELAGVGLEDSGAVDGCVPRGTTLPPCTELEPSDEVVLAAAAM